MCLWKKAVEIWSSVIWNGENQSDLAQEECVCNTWTVDKLLAEVSFIICYAIVSTEAKTRRVLIGILR